MTPTPDTVLRLEAGAQSVLVDPAVGGRAVSWSVGGIELLAHDGDAPVQYGMYPMAPWAGRVRGNAVTWRGQHHDLPVTHADWALHGTCLARAGRVVEHRQDADSAALVLVFDEHPEWPWPISVEVTWALSAAALVTTIAVQAPVEPFPAVVGWHPWFRRRLDSGSDVAWELEATERLVRGDDHLPTGERVPFDPGAGPFDDAFVVPSGRARLRWPGAMSVDVTASGGWYVVFDERPAAVCLEPQSGPPDGLDGEHGLAAPGQPLVHTVTWRAQREA